MRLKTIRNLIFAILFIKLAYAQVTINTIVVFLSILHIAESGAAGIQWDAFKIFGLLAILWPLVVTVCIVCKWDYKLREGE